MKKLNFNLVFNGYMKVPLQADSQEFYNKNSEFTGDWANRAKCRKIFKKPRKFLVNVYLFTTTDIKLHISFTTPKLSSEGLIQAIKKAAIELTETDYIDAYTEEFTKATSKLLNKPIDALDVQMIVHQHLFDLVNEICELEINLNKTFAVIRA